MDEKKSKEQYFMTHKIKLKFQCLLINLYFYTAHTLCLYLPGATFVL